VLVRPWRLAWSQTAHAGRHRARSKFADDSCAKNCVVVEALAAASTLVSENALRSSKSGAKRKRTTIKGGKAMAIRTGSAVWEGTLKDGRGTMKVGSGAFEGPFSFLSRFESGKGTNPEELIGAAEAGCFSMALAFNLQRAGHSAKHVSTTATVKLEPGEGGFKITSIDLKTEADVPGIDEAKFREQAELTKKTCPVSVALAGTQINLDAKLL
jgi:osmotically inducible protein OsmC